MKRKNYTRTVVTVIQERNIRVTFHNWLAQRSVNENMAKKLTINPTLASLERLNRVMSAMKPDSVTVELGLPETFTTFLYAGDYYV